MISIELLCLLKYGSCGFRAAASFYIVLVTRSQRNESHTQVLQRVLTEAVQRGSRPSEPLTSLDIHRVRPFKNLQLITDGGRAAVARSGTNAEILYPEHHRKNNSNAGLSWSWQLCTQMLTTQRQLL